MNEVKMLSDRKVERLIHYANEDGNMSSKCLSVSADKIYKTTDRFGLVAYAYKFYLINTIYKKIYSVDENEYSRIIEAIETGKKFIKIEKDIINVGQIKVIQEKEVKETFEKSEQVPDGKPIMKNHKFLEEQGKPPFKYQPMKTIWVQDEEKLRQFEDELSGKIESKLKTDFMIGR